MFLYDIFDYLALMSYNEFALPVYICMISRPKHFFKTGLREDMANGVASVLFFFFSLQSSEGDSPSLYLAKIQGHHKSTPIKERRIFS